MFRWIDRYTRWIDGNRFHALRTPLHDLYILIVSLFTSANENGLIQFNVQICWNMLKQYFRILNINFPLLIFKYQLSECCRLLSQPARRWCLYSGIGLWHWQHMVEKENREGGRQWSIQIITKVSTLRQFLPGSPYWQSHEIVKELKVLQSTFDKGFFRSRTLIGFFVYHKMDHF